MKFFDSKEEVLDVQLTQYGRYLLSKGVWKPTYYAFYDDNILYDANYGGVSTENKNDAESRIQENTPILKTQSTFTGRDEYLFDGLDDQNDDHFSLVELAQIQVDRTRLSSYEKLNVIPMSLGTTSPDSTKTPAFKIQFLEGRIDNLEYNLTGTVRSTNIPAPSVATYSQQLLKIPQIESDVEFKISVVDPANSQVKFEVDPALTPGGTYLDGTSVVVGPAQMLLVVEEKNTTFDYENFDIEVYEITDEIGPLGEQVMNQLSFIKPLQMVENNILIDKKEAEQIAGRVNGQIPSLDPTYVEYYFNINVDTEIDENMICKAISELKSNNILMDIDIKCPDILTPIRANIYASDAEDEECPDN